MYFTQEDFKKIEKWLADNAVKDTDFSEASPLEGKEIVVIVQEGHNKKISIKQLIDYFSSLEIKDLLNVSTKYNSFKITLSKALSLVEDKDKRKGQILTFLNTEGVWEIVQFFGDIEDWYMTSLWKNAFSVEDIKKFTYSKSEIDNKFTSVNTYIKNLDLNKITKDECRVLISQHSPSKEEFSKEINNINKSIFNIDLNKISKKECEDLIQNLTYKKSDIDSKLSVINTNIKSTQDELETLKSKQYSGYTKEESDARYFIGENKKENVEYLIKIK